jgi:hypothetical protein
MIVDWNELLQPRKTSGSKSVILGSAEFLEFNRFISTPAYECQWLLLQQQATATWMCCTNFEGLSTGHSWLR